MAMVVFIFSKKYISYGSRPIMIKFHVKHPLSVNKLVKEKGKHSLAHLSQRLK